MGNHLLLAVITVSIMVTHSHRVSTESGNDATMTPNVPGANVVEQALKIIRTTCVFEDDNLFMRRLAYVETHDGEDGGTFREDYDGGIWKVNENMFEHLKTPAMKTKLAKYTDRFLSELDIDWEQTSWVDCRKARVSALAAHLYMLTKVDIISRELNDQALEWTEHYHNSTRDSEDFVDAANELKQRRKEKCGVDLAFVLDASGSVGPTNFEKMKDFVRDVIEHFDVHADGTRVSVMHYASQVKTEFYLDTYTNKTAMLKHVDGIRHTGGGTRTDLALAELYKEIFTLRQGSRPSEIPKFTILATDGQSANPAQTVIEANKVHAEDITVFAVGVAGAIMKELKAIASEPKCLTLLMLDDFKGFESLSELIMESACEAPIVVSPGENGTVTKPSLPAGGNKNCKVKVSDEGATVKVNAEAGTVNFYVSNKTYPSASYYEARVKAQPGFPGVLFMDKPNTPESEGIIFCNIEGDKEVPTTPAIGVMSGDQDYCKDHKCTDWETCVDDLKSGYTCVMKNGGVKTCPLIAPSILMLIMFSLWAF